MATERGTDMYTNLTDRDERVLQRSAEERWAEPLPIGDWIRKFGAVLAVRGRKAARTASAAASCSGAALQKTV